MAMAARLITGLLLLLLTVSAPAPAPAQTGDDPIAAATQLFTKYVNLEHGYWPAVGDLYADEAVIRNRRKYPNGEVRELTLSAAQYRALLHQAMPIAKQRGDRSSYSEVTYTAEGPNVRITATRFSELKRYSSPLSLLVGRRADGRWMIYEELSESQP
ncbi:MAG: hypothetical protein ACREJY_05525 [Candidatus Rokuibacteriota bacterium]